MAKQKKVLAARKRNGDDESLLVRSAESLGRMIGTLQRQLEGVTGRVSQKGQGASGEAPDLSPQVRSKPSAKTRRHTTSDAPAAARHTTRSAAATRSTRPATGTRSGAARRKSATAARGASSGPASSKKR